METQELKSLLYESIENIDDQDVLLTVQQILERKYTPADKIRLSREQRAGIDLAKQQIEAGEYVNHEQAEALVEKWLNE